MSMEISGNYKDYKNEYLERAQTEQDKVKRTSQEQKIKVRGFQFQRTSISAVKNPAASPVVCIV